MPSRFELPDKLYFKIGEVAKLAGVKQHVLRYWESEFPSIRPQKSKSNQRLYRRKDVEAVLAIKNLLYEKKFTIEGAKKFIKDQGVDSAMPALDPREIVSKVREEAQGEIEEGLRRQKADLRRTQQKDLLDLRRRLTDFLTELDKA